MAQEGSIWKASILPCLLWWIMTPVIDADSCTYSGKKCDRGDTILITNATKAQDWANCNLKPRCAIGGDHHFECKCSNKRFISGDICGSTLSRKNITFIRNKNYPENDNQTYRCECEVSFTGRVPNVSLSHVENAEVYITDESKNFKLNKYDCQRNDPNCRLETKLQQRLPPKSGKIRVISPAQNGTGRLWITFSAPSPMNVRCKEIHPKDPEDNSSSESPPEYSESASSSVVPVTIVCVVAVIVLVVVAVVAVWCLRRHRRYKDLQAEISVRYRKGRPPERNPTAPDGTMKENDIYQPGNYMKENDIYQSTGPQQNHEGMKDNDIYQSAVQGNQGVEDPSGPMNQTSIYALAGGFRDTDEAEYSLVDNVYDLAREGGNEGAMIDNVIYESSNLNGKDLNQSDLKESNLSESGEKFAMKDNDLYKPFVPQGGRKEGPPKPPRLSTAL